MKILYTTDLHGRIKAYETVFERAKTHSVSAIVNGGDLYALGRDLFEVQREFLTGFFREYLARCHREGIVYLATLGNMDLKGHDALFRRIMSETPGAYCLLEDSVKLSGYTFVGSAMTTDGPFSLKDRCLRDTADSSPPRSQGSVLLSDARGIHQVEDWPAIIHKLPTLAEHLKTLPCSENPDKTVYVLHQPPYGVGQGLLSGGIDVGSHAVASFLNESSALLSLHGHIHESPFVGGNWRSKIGRTVCVQPGQLSVDRCITVLIDLETLEMERSG